MSIPPWGGRSVAGAFASYPLSPGVPRAGAVPRDAAISSNSDNPHRLLFDLIHVAHTSRQGRFSGSVQATIVRQLYLTIWSRPEWARLFLVDQGRTNGPGESSQVEHPPSMKNVEDWVKAEGIWSLNNWQDKVEVRRRRAGKLPVRRVRPGTSCGKIMQRYERSYTCK